MNKNEINYGFMLRLLRQNLHLSQESLAKKLGTNRENISRYESGNREFRLSPPQIASFIELLWAAGYSMDDIIKLCRNQ